MFEPLKQKQKLLSIFIFFWLLLFGVEPQFQPTPLPAYMSRGTG